MIMWPHTQGKQIDVKGSHHVTKPYYVITKLVKLKIDHCIIMLSYKL